MSVVLVFRYSCPARLESHGTGRALVEGGGDKVELCAQSVSQSVSTGVVGTVLVQYNR